MQIKQELIPKSRYSIKATHPMTPKFVVIHNTYNDASAKNEIAYMTRNDNYTSFHIAVDDIEAIQAIPFNRNAWAQGDGSNGKGNRNGISVEICYSKSGGSRFDKAEENAAKVTAQILKEFNWGIDKVYRHKDFSNKNCPHRTMAKGWQRFLNMISDELNEDKGYYVKGDKGNKVEELQKDLEKLGYSVGSWGANGIFGNDTEAAVKKFQKDTGLVVDGSAGPATLAKIKNLLEIKKQSDELYKVQVGAYSKKENADKKLEELKNKGIDGYIKKE